MNAAVRRTGSVVLAALAIFASSTTPTASAGTYTATPNPCELLTYPLGSTWHSGYPGGGLWCASGFERSMALGSISNGGRIWMKSQKLRDEAHLKTFSMWSYYGDAGGPDAPLLWRICRRAMWEVPSAQQQCGGDTVALRGHAANWTTRAASNIDLVCGTHCAGVQFESQYNAVDANLAVSSVTASIGDDTNPAFTPAARQINSGQWLSGSVSLGGAASDNGGGVSSINLLLDMAGSNPSLAVNPNTGCTAGAWIPCPDSYSWSGTFNTAASPALSDGPHTARYTVSDPAGNVVHLPQFTYRTDNTRPGTPGGMTAVADGINGWSAVNDFGASWTNTGETVETATQSGIAKVIVDVNPTHAGQSNPAAVEVPVGSTVSGITASIDSVTGVTVPSNGRWTVQIKLVDRAGNVSLVHPGSEVLVGVDPDAPAKTEGRANGWASASELISGSVVQRWNPPSVPGPDDSPVCGWALSVSQNQHDSGGTTITVHAPNLQWIVPAGTPEGTNWVHIRAISCAGVPSDETDHQELKVDRTDPTPSFSGVEAGRWYMSGQQVTICGSDALSGMAPAPSVEPDSTLGAHISYKINGVGPAAADSPRGACATIVVTGEGAKELSFSPVDFAGNRSSPTVVNFGIDATPPEGYLDDQDSAKPTLLRAVLTDAASGLSHAIIQYRPAGGGAWTSLPTSLASFSGGIVGDAPQSAIAEAHFPDTKLPKGIYELRVVAADVAGNETITSTDKHGNTFTVTNPMRKATGLSAAIYNVLRKCKRTRGSKCVKKKKGTVYLTGGKSSVTVGYRRAGVIQGFLTQGTNYAALAEQPLEIYTKVQGQAEVLDGVTSTRADGSWYYRLKPGVSRSVRIVFPGTELLQNDEAKVEFKTAAKITLKVSKRKAKTGGKVTFSGKITAVDKAFPGRGKIIALQYLSGGKWRPAVAITRTTRSGKFKVHYRFDRIPRNARAKIKFRVYAPSELDFHHGNSTSRHKVVRVNW